MDRPNMGFALSLALLLLGPPLPIRQFIQLGDSNASISLGAAGLAIWFMLAPSLPVRAVLRMPTLLALVGLSVYVLLVSLTSGRTVSIAYALQFAFYGVVGGLLIPAYLVHRTQQGRQAEVWRILAWVGAIYAGGIIVSMWTGPIYSYRMDQGGKHLGSLLIPRYVGFSESANVAGGIAAFLGVFYMFLYPSSRLKSALLAALSLTGMVLTLSRSAIGAFVLAVVLLGALLAFRALFLRGRVGHLRLRPVPIAFVVLGLVAGVVSYQQRIVSAAWERLVLNQDYLGEDVDMRLVRWSSGVERWADLSPTERIIGEGFHGGDVVSKKGAFITAHNFYVAFLADFGIVGFLIFAAILATAMMRAARLILFFPTDSMARFCWCGLAMLVIHNMTEVFFYGMEHLIELILLLTCIELAERRAAALAGGALIPGAARDGGLVAMSR